VHFLSVHPPAELVCLVMRFVTARAVLALAAGDCAFMAGRLMPGLCGGLSAAIHLVGYVCELLPIPPTWKCNQRKGELARMKINRNNKIS